MTTKKGFTLVELMLAASIIVILTSISFLNYKRGIDKKFDGEREMVIKGLDLALGLYRANNFGLVPTVNQNWQTSFQPLIAKNIIDEGDVGLDPTTDVRAVDSTYSYCSGQGGRKYLLIAFFENAPTNQPKLGSISSYSAGECVNQGGVISGNFTAWKNSTVCGGVNSEGFYVYCLGSL